jgi:hypothetical protein
LLELLRFHFIRVVVTLHYHCCCITTVHVHRLLSTVTPQSSAVKRVHQDFRYLAFVSPTFSLILLICKSSSLEAVLWGTTKT